MQENMRRNLLDLRNRRSNLLRRLCDSRLYFCGSTHGHNCRGSGEVGEDEHPVEARSCATAWKRFTSRFLVCALPFLASFSILTPVCAHDGHDDTPGLFDSVAGLWKRADKPSVNIPKRRVSADTSHAADHEEGDQDHFSVQPSPAVPPVVVPKRRRGESVQPSPAVTPVNATSRGEAVELQTTSTPNHVTDLGEGVGATRAFRAAQDVIAEIAILRQALDIRDLPPEDEFVPNRAPIHVYAKSLEVLDKVLETQQRLFVPVGKAGQIPFKEIDEDDVLINIEYILIELRRIKTRMGINFRIEPAPSGIGAPFSMTYKTLADASFMLDGLRGRTLTTNDVYGNAVSILDELALVAERFNTPLSYEPTPVETKMKTLDVALQVMRVRYQLVDMQTMLGMDASGVPSMTLSRVTPSQNYDATNLLLAEMARIRLHLGVNQPRVVRPERSTDMGPNDAFALVLLISQNLDTLLDALTEAASG